MSTQPPARIRTLGELKRTVERIAPLVSPEVRSTGSAEGVSVATGSSSAQVRIPDQTVPTLSGIVAERRLEGGGSISSDTQIIPAGTRVEYKVTTLYNGLTTDWLLASNDALRQLPRYAAPIDGECRVSRWPQDDGTTKVVLELIAVEEGVGAVCP